MPLGSKDEAYKNANTLGFFSSEQALADYAQIIIDVKKNISAENSPIIAMGGSYGGKTFCNATDGAGKNAYIPDKIVAGFESLWGKGCIYLYASGLDKTYGWDWQSCTEMVMPMGRGENDTIYQADPFDLDKSTKECEQVFGINPRPYWAPIQFGGYGLKTVPEKFGSNIIFSNGLRDPYSSGGVLQNISDRIVALYTEAGHHCLDIRTAMDTDPGWLVEQRNSEMKNIEAWLSKYMISVASKHIT